VIELHIQHIRNKAQTLRERYHTDDPREICREMGIRIMEHAMGTDPDSCKGFFVIRNRCRVIVLNSDLPGAVRRIVLAHEIGHALLHGDMAISAFHDFSVFNSANTMEYEANVFAAEFLLSDAEVLDALREQPDFFALSSLLNVPPELLAFKFRILQKAGHPLRIPIDASGDFLRRDITKPLC